MLILSIVDTDSEQEVLLNVFNDDYHRLPQIQYLGRLVELENKGTLQEPEESSKATWVRGKEAASFEGLGILVKVEGTEEAFGEKEGILFSAHFDSLSSGPAVKDDAISTVTLLAFVEYPTTHRVGRTSVFNFNNSEEVGLNGAHAFLEHPWSKIPHRFLNLEGIGAGGRPFLFRSALLCHGRMLLDRFYCVHEWPRPRYRNGRTGYSILRRQGMVSYNTRFTSWRGWCEVEFVGMMRTIKDTGFAVLNEETMEREDVKAVYFDVFGKCLVAQASLVLAILKFNPYIVHSPYTLLISTFSLVYLTIVALLCTVHLGTDRKTLGLQLYTLTYLFNAAGTCVLHKIEIGDVFSLMTWHFCAILGKRSDEVHAIIRTFRIPESTEKGKRKRKSLNATEETPLLTMGERKLALEIYADTVFIILPILPFTSSIHQKAAVYALLAFALSTILILTTFPFNTDAPMKVFFEQRVQFVAPELPLTWGKNVSHELEKDKSGPWTCLWKSELLPSTGPDTSLAGNDCKTPLTFNALRKIRHAWSHSVSDTAFGTPQAPKTILSYREAFLLMFL
ncbi:hypothetical protein BDQ17DRAFT_1335727 [Cyathus striatus]|nr:hypothetical protein BDQ17DRAFT_1335727 [Cyathus striatus]